MTMLTKIKFIFLIQLANFFILIVLLYVLLWGLMAAVNLQSAQMKLLDMRQAWQLGTMGEEDQNALSLETQVESYKVRHYKPGYNGSVYWATFVSVKNHS